MSSLKEIKTRIASVNSTMKITSAMKMVASAKLRKAQRVSEAFLPYQHHLSSILERFLVAETDFISPYTITREVNKVAIVALSSNSSLCGAFNSTVIKELYHIVSSYEKLGKENILIFPVGKKIYDACVRQGWDVQSYATLMDSPNYASVIQFADELMELFASCKVDRIEIIYQHFQSSSSQKIQHSTFLPLHPASVTDVRNIPDYIVEPSRTELIAELIPLVLHTRIYAALLDSYAAEQSARTMAMQIATDNASDLLAELTVQYNKSRQQAITNELLDIMGGIQR